MIGEHPYLRYFFSLPTGCRRDRSLPVGASELASPAWLEFKARVAAHFSWAVPTGEAIETIAQAGTHWIEVGCGSGYWAWLMRIAGLDVVASDVVRPSMSWHPIVRADERILLHAEKRSLFLCWPPWNTPFASTALALFAGEYIAYVGEWGLGCGTPEFFQRLTDQFHVVCSVEIPQWYMRDDRLLLLQRN